jgi:riboflavin kinase/FMN adenylyltransferase
MALIHKLTALASAGRLSPIAYMFGEHPLNVLYGDGSAKLLTSNDVKCAMLGRTALDCLCIDKFDARFAKMAPDDFARRVLRGRLGARLVVAGFNYRFGAGNSATVEDLARLGGQFGFGVHVLPPYKAGGDVVSSSGIRSLVESGRVAEAREMLGRLFFIRGTVRDGMRVGRTIGVPTANLLVSPCCLLPLQGVYATSAFAAGRFYNAVTNVGPSPTVGGLPQGTVETHLIGYSGDLYGLPLEVRFHKRLRGMEKFANVIAMRAQIQRDIEAAGEYFS